MLQNYFLAAWRSLVKNRLSSFINIFGLAMGLATAILIFLYINQMLSYDRFHTHYANIYQLMKTERGSSEVSTGSSIAGPVAGAILAEIPEIRQVARGAYDEPLFSYKDKSLYQRTLYTDPSFFHFMTFPALKGRPDLVLRDPGMVVITESAAKRLFGSEDPMGKTITQNSTHQLKVGAVIRDAPALSSHRFDIIQPFSFFEKDNGWLKKWDDNRIFTWVELPASVQLPALDAKLTALLQKKAGDKHLELFAYPLRDVWLRNSFKNGKQNGGRINILQLMGAIGIFVLAIACINFMNLSTARSERRSREVGVRKTLGASRRVLIFQFLIEAGVMTFFAMILGIILAQLFLPFFNRIMEKTPIVFDLSDGHVWAGLLVISLFTGLMAGSYPAFFLSRFQPLRVLKGVFTPGHGGALFRKILVTFQFVLTIFLIFSTIVILKQEAYVENRPIGYDKENLIVIAARATMADNFPLFRNEVGKIPGVTSISAGSDDLVKFRSGNNGLDWPGKTPDQDFYVQMTEVGYDWVKTAGFTMVQGRDFSPSFGSDTSACLLNEAAVRKMGLKQPVIGTKVGGAPVIGVVKDFIYNDAFNDPEPMVVNLSRGALGNFFVRFRNNSGWRETLSQIQELVKKDNPGYPFDYYFVSEEYERQFQGIHSTVQVLNGVGILAILISCLGLFGLSAFLAERRTKEIGVRKILGAGVARIWFGLSKDFLQPVLIAFLVAAPLGGWAMKMLLQHFDYRIGLSWWLFALAGLLAFFIALATVSYQGIRAARANPIKSLRTE